MSKINSKFLMSFMTFIIFISTFGNIISYATESPKIVSYDNEKTEQIKNIICTAALNHESSADISTVDCYIELNKNNWTPWIALAESAINIPYLDEHRCQFVCSETSENSGKLKLETVYLEYMPQKQYKALQNEINKCMSLLNGNMTDFEKVLTIHDYMAENIKFVSEDTTNTKYHTAYSALVGKETVCDGYARAFSILLNKAEIPNHYVAGYVMKKDKISAHAWNMVQLNGKWYHIDLTWDRIVSSKTGEVKIRHDYFLRSDEIMKKDHCGWDTDLPTCKSERYNSYQMPDKIIK